VGFGWGGGGGARGVGGGGRGLGLGFAEWGLEEDPLVHWCCGGGWLRAVFFFVGPLVVPSDSLPLTPTFFPSFLMSFFPRVNPKPGFMTVQPRSPAC